MESTKVILRYALDPLCYTRDIYISHQIYMNKMGWISKSAGVDGVTLIRIYK